MGILLFVENDIGSGGAKTIAEALPHSNLQKIIFDCTLVFWDPYDSVDSHSIVNIIGDTGAKALALALPHSNIRVLGLICMTDWFLAMFNYH